MRENSFILWLIISGVFFCSLSAQKNAPDTAIAAINQEKGLGFLYQGKWDSALVKFQVSAIQFAANGDSGQYLMSRFYQAYCYRASGRFQDFLQYESHIQPYLTAQDSLVPQVFQALGGAHYRAAHFHQALTYYEQALEAVQERYTFLAELLPEIYNNQALIYRRLGDYDQALLFYEKFAAQYEDYPELEYPTPVGIALPLNANNIGQVKRDQEDFTGAIVSFQRAMRGAGNVPARYARAFRENLALAYRETGMLDSALYFLRLNLTQQRPEDRTWGQTLRNLGELYGMMGNYEAALDTLLLALGHRKTVYSGKHPNTARVYQSLGEMYLSQAKPFESLLQLQQAIAQLDPSYDPDSLYQQPDLSDPEHGRALLDILWAKGEAFSSLASVEENEKYQRAVVETYTVASRLADSLRWGYDGEGAKLMLSGKVIPGYERAIEAALGLHEKNPGGNFLATAYTFAQKSKAAVLLEMIQNNQAKARGGLPDSLLRMERSLQLQIAEVEKSLKTVSDSAQRNRFIHERFTLKQQHQALIDKWEKTYPDYFRLKYDYAPPTLADIQKHLHAEQQVLEYFWGEKHVFVFSITAADVSVQQIKLEDEWVDILTVLIKDLRDGKQVEATGNQAESRQQFGYNSGVLYQKLMQEVIDSTAHQLVIIRDGLLGYLPFEVLTMDIPTAEEDINFADLSYVFRKFAVRYVYSSYFLTQKPAQDASPAELFAGFAPVYTSDIDPGSSRSSGISRGIRLIAGDRSGFAPLVNNQPEVQAIQKILGGNNYLGHEATESHFKANASQYAVLHLAAHAFANDEEPWYSALIFSEENAEDGFLYAYEIPLLNLQADLIVLSACNTGTGKLARGEGILSLSRAFTYAGSSNVLMSLWQADDASTRLLMERFYVHLDQGLGKDEALRQARLDYLNQSDQSHPFYWGAFILMGDDLPLNKGGWGWLNWVIGIGLLGVLLWLAQYIFRRTRKSNHVEP